MPNQLRLTALRDSYFSFAQSKSGYSGVATFCRKTTSVPFESFSSLGSFINSQSFDLEQLDTSWIDIAELDAEGRCLITDHGEFVLFNIYAPALTSEDSIADRIEFKMSWFQVSVCDGTHVRYLSFQVLHACVTSLIRNHKNVVLMGDFNCSPHLIDHCDPGAKEDFYSRPVRSVFLSMLAEREGPCYDIFRILHPSRFCLPEPARQSVL